MADNNAAVPRTSKLEDLPPALLHEIWIWSANLDLPLVSHTLEGKLFDRPIRRKVFRTMLADMVEFIEARQLSNSDDSDVDKETKELRKLQVNLIFQNLSIPRNTFLALAELVRMRVHEQEERRKAERRRLQLAADNNEYDSDGSDDNDYVPDGSDGEDFNGLRNLWMVFADGIDVSTRFIKAPTPHNLALLEEMVNLFGTSAPTLEVKIALLGALLCPGRHSWTEGPFRRFKNFFDTCFLEAYAPLAVLKPAEIESILTSLDCATKPVLGSQESAFPILDRLMFLFARTYQRMAFFDVADEPGMALEY